MKSNLALSMLGLAWLLGTGALNLGLLGEDGALLATLAFLAAAVLWLTSYRLLKAAGRMAHILCLLLLLLWAFNLAVAAVVGRAEVCRTTFFIVSAPVTAALLVLAGLPLVRKKVD